jgi:hypothetical protein
MTAKSEPAAKSGAWLDRLERLGNLLPDPVVIFLILSGAVIIVSALVAATGWSAVHPVTGKVLHVQSLLSVENVRKLLVDMPDTLTGFPPLGLVLVVILGASVAERSGLFHALLGGAVRRIPRAAMTPERARLGISVPAARAAWCPRARALTWHSCAALPRLGAARVAPGAAAMIEAPSPHEAASCGGVRLADFFPRDAGTALARLPTLPALNCLLAGPAHRCGAAAQRAG